VLGKAGQSRVYGKATGRYWETPGSAQARQIEPGSHLAHLGV
jgi:hypothetical protein